jgi:hypothetical protein
MALDLEHSLRKRWAFSNLWSGRFDALQTKRRCLKITHQVHIDAHTGLTRSSQLDIDDSQGSR